MMDEIRAVATLNLNSGNVTGNSFANVGNQTHIVNNLQILVQPTQARKYALSIPEIQIEA